MHASRLANGLTMSRFVLSPLFAVVFFVMLPARDAAMVGVVLIWIIFALVEISDVLDGAVARKSNSVSDIGKLMDPFADVISKVTYFVCLLVGGLLPVWFVLVVLYREFGILFIRMILYRDGIALGARLAGKLKTWFYAVTAAAGLVFASRAALAGTAPSEALPRWGELTMLVLGIVTAVLSLASFVQYLTLFIRARRK